jgi:hypothetical protein
MASSPNPTGEGGGGTFVLFDPARRSGLSKQCCDQESRLPVCAESSANMGNPWGVEHCLLLVILRNDPIHGKIQEARRSE